MSWGELARRAPESLTLEGDELRAGSTVRLHPARSGDIFDLALEGRLAIVDGIEQDTDGRLLVAVRLADDLAASFGAASQLGHRFFFSLQELEPAGNADDAGCARAKGQILVAGIGNVFLGDDGFGVEVANSLRTVDLGPGIWVEEFGIRGMDLAYALSRELEAAILIDAAARGEPPGTLSVIEADAGEGEPWLETHGMDPLKVLATARQLGALPARVLIVACEPGMQLSGEEDEVVMELSEPVRAAIAPAAELVRTLVGELVESRGDTR